MDTLKVIANQQIDIGEFLLNRPGGRPFALILEAWNLPGLLGLDYS